MYPTASTCLLSVATGSGCASVLNTYSSMGSTPSSLNSSQAYFIVSLSQKLSMWSFQFDHSCT